MVNAGRSVVQVCSRVQGSIARAREKRLPERSDRGLRVRRLSLAAYVTLTLLRLASLKTLLSF